MPYPHDTPPAYSRRAHQFEVNPAGGGYEVLDTTTGHPVSGVLAFEQASEEARILNGSFAHSRRALCASLGAVETPVHA